MLNGFGESQRKLLNELLQNQEGMTIANLGKALHISRTAVNQHINALEKEQFLEKFTLSSTGGRPGKVYKLSDKGMQLFPKQYALFSNLLLKNLKNSLGSAGLEKMLTGLGEQIAEQFAPRLHDKTMAEKNEEIALIMQELGYQSSVENKNILKACNCVYHDLAKDNPEVCSFDLALISALSGRHVQHTDCMVRGGYRCRFKIKEKLQSSEKSRFQVLEKIEQPKVA